jgi:UDP-N-acetylenolpyruvoylglucosamine reductase
VEALVAHIQQVVADKFGVTLTPEFRTTGESL